MAMSRVLSGVLFGVSPVDALGVGGAALLVVSVAVLTAVSAARPIARLDPTAVLRHE
jgi:hypothetical protein